MIQNLISKNNFRFLLSLVLLLNSLTLFNEIMEPDGALYATLAKQMVVNSDWLNLYSLGADWLDKPHLPFWLAAISFKCFGINSFAYKLPSFICFIVALIYCYKLAKAIYSTEVAKLSILIFGTALHIIVSNFDGKAEIYLTAFVIASIYHLYQAHNKKWFWHIILASFFIACACMTKGVFSIIIITAGFVIYWIKTKQWNQFINIKWYLVFLFTFIFILPEFVALYTQFDSQPSKIVFGKTNVSGLRFFFWDSQFGRFFNNGPIKGKGDLSFFLHTFLWAFLPWVGITLLSIYNIVAHSKKSNVNFQRWIIGASCLVSFLMFSLSKFQLPHYIVVLFPHFAMFTANYLLENVTANTLKKIIIFQIALFCILLIALLSLTLVYTSLNYVFVFCLLFLSFLSLLFIRDKSYYLKILRLNVFFALVLSIFLNLLFYPSLLKYQAGLEAGKWLNNKGINKPVVIHNAVSYSFEFYYNGQIDFSKPNLQSYVSSSSFTDSVFVFGKIDEVKALAKDTISVSILNSFAYFRVSQLNPMFINFKTREKALETFVIAVIKKYKLKV